jgi:hypothetical protein
MRVSLLMAGGLTTFVAVAHSYLGERYILRRLFRRTGLPKLFGGEEFTKRTLRFAWHLTSIAWLGLAFLMIVLASSPGSGLLTHARAVAAVFAMSALAALVGSHGRHLSWLAFLAVALLVWLGYP